MMKSEGDEDERKNAPLAVFWCNDCLFIGGWSGLMASFLKSRTIA